MQRRGLRDFRSEVATRRQVPARTPLDGGQLCWHGEVTSSLCASSLERGGSSDKAPLGVSKCQPMLVHSRVLGAAALCLICAIKASSRAGQRGACCRRNDAVTVSVASHQTMVELPAYPSEASWPHPRSSSSFAYDNFSACSLCVAMCNFSNGGCRDYSGARLPHFSTARGLRSERASFVGYHCLGWIR